MATTTEQPKVKPSPVNPEQGNGHGDHGNHDGGEHGIPPDLKVPSTGSVIIALAVFVALMVVLFLIGWIPDHRESVQARNDANDRAAQLPIVSYMIPSITPSEHELTLPCDVKANQQTAIYTRTNGYLKKWNFDIGQHVEAGQLMAEIETPEVDAQLAQSQASLKQNEAAVIKAEADQDLAQKTLDRYNKANAQSPGSVTEEAIDQNKSALKDAEAALNQAHANVAAAQANVQQLTTQVGFEKVFAPFTGTVTARNYDVGALLSPTNTGAGSEIFDLAQTDPLRVFVNVPQQYANSIKLHEPAKLFVRNFPNKPFLGEIALTSGAVDPNTRTLSVQINFPNKDGKLFAGEFGEVHLPVEGNQKVALVPTSALIFNAQAKGLQLSVVTDIQKDDKGKDVGTVKMKSIKTGRDFGTNIEVSDGIADGDHVITNPSERTGVDAKVQALAMPTDTVTNPPPTTKPVDVK